MNAVAQQDVKIPATIRISAGLWKRAKKAAIDRGCSASELAEEGLRALLGANNGHEPTDPSGNES